jgi:hypothetical protein
MRRRPFSLSLAALAAFILVGGAGAFAASAFDDFWRSTGKSYPADGAFRRPPLLAPGQFVVAGLSINGRHERVTRTLVVGRAGQNWILENATYDKNGGENLVQIEIEGYEAALATGDASRIRILRMTTRDGGGRLVEKSGPAPGIYGEMMKLGFQRMIVGTEGFSAGGRLSVPAGVFPATHEAQSYLSIFGNRMRMENWYSAEVPISGIVRSVSSDGRNVTELLAFGYDGKPSL